MNLARRVRGTRIPAERQETPMTVQDTQDTEPQQDQAPEPIEPGAAEYSDDWLTAGADRLETEARGKREQAAATIEEAERALAEARATVAALERAARGARQNATYSVEADANRLDQRATAYRGAVKLRAQGAEHDQIAADLAAEAEDLAEQDQAFADRLAHVGALRADAQAALTQARQDADVTAIATATTTIDACSQAEAALTAQRRPGLDRLAAIGTEDGQGELHKALQAAANTRRDAERWLDQEHPDRPSAVQAKWMADRELTLAALESLAAAERRGQRSTTVLGGPNGRITAVTAPRR